MTSAASPEEVFRLGASFEHSAQAIVHSMVVAKGGAFTVSASIGSAPPGMVPMVVCMTFSVELYLKCLVWLETGAPRQRGHSLVSLFGLIAPARQARVKHHYDAFIGPHRDRIEATPAPDFGPGSTEFGSALQVASDGFADWRYAYERNMVSGPNLAQYFAYAVRRSIIEVRPDWEQFLTGLSIPPTSLTH